MLQPSEVLPGSVRLSDVPGNDGKFAVEESLPEVDRFINSGNNLGLFFGVTGCGKSKILPAHCAELLSKEQRRGKLLVLTTAAKDVEDMHRHCSMSSHFRIGGGTHGGCAWTKASVIFTTVGLASRWYANDGIEAFKDFGAALLDEFGTVERDIGYSFMFEVMQKIQSQRPENWPFIILMCTASMSERLTEAVALLGPSKIECLKRPYPLERYMVKVNSLTAMYEAMASGATDLLRSGRTVLVFLPGQVEITSVQELLTGKGAGSKIIF
jgi:HrpA-like RNA helicase